MLNKTVVAVFAIMIAVFTLQPIDKAEAKVNVHIGVGSGYYGDPYYGRPRYYPPQPYYGGGYYAPPRPVYRPYRARRISCRQGRRIVRNRGFYKVKARDCRGRNYVFHGRKNGRKYRIRMRSRNGRIYSVGRR